MTTEPSRTLETNRLLLRPFKPDDLEDLLALNSDEETMRYITEPLDREQVAQVIDWFISEWSRLGYGWFAVLKKDSGDFVGQCGLQCLEGRPESADVELAFVISKAYWGLGYATEAAQAVATFAMEEAGLKRIVAVTMAANVQSQRVLEKLHFQFEANRELYGRTVMYYSLASV